MEVGGVGVVSILILNHIESLSRCIARSRRSTLVHFIDAAAAPLAR